MKIPNVVASDPGSFHDAFILRQSAVFPAFEDPNGPPLTGHLLGDSGYMLRPLLLTPYINPRGRTQERFNFAHSSTRATIERCNGVLKRRWHCLHGELRYSPGKACKIIGACAVLHNICLTLPVSQNCCNVGCVHYNDSISDRACQEEQPQHRRLIQEGNAAAVRNTFADAYFGR
ncbi:putative nuclease HARBI1 [Dreissena polymorpha]|uniref:putative nuclease HARBI1 n=1 Tax=Dreissena polymorpha TaxID=45954 RepID=UPI002263CEA2|nr:putative nuclease HARBI1 [Dreissena polymorpha]